MERHLPASLHPWIDQLVPAVHVAMILLVAFLLRWLVRTLMARLSRRYDLPIEVAVGVRRVAGFVIGFAALLAVLRVFGVSGGVLWGAFTGFATVAAVAFFAAWSVLTNVFCAFLIMVTRPFRLHDHVELMESGDKPGLRGRVVDINLIYVTLRERHGHSGSSVLRVPNSMFFQRAIRRWEAEPPAEVLLAPVPGQQAKQGGTPPPVGGGGSSTVAE